MATVTSLRVLYSFGARVGAEGLGTLAYEDARALHRHDVLQRLLCGFMHPGGIPPSHLRVLGMRDRVLRKLCAYEHTQALLHLQNLNYDRWASRWLEPSDMLVVWNSYGLRSLRRAKDMGMTTAVIRASTHPQHVHQVLSEEHARWGTPYRHPRVRRQRLLDEIEAADAVIIPSDGVRSTYLEHGVAAAKLAPLSGFGVDVDTYHPRPRPPGAPFRVLFVGSVGIRKGVPYLLQAWERLGWTDAELCLVGAVGHELRAVVQRYRALPGLRFAGHQREALPFFQSADVFVLPSLEEGSARATYEAMACGLPVVTTAETGSPVRHEREGFIVPIRDADQLATRLEQLRADDRLRTRLSVAARRRAESFTWTAYGVELVRLLAGITERRRG